MAHTFSCSADAPLVRTTGGSVRGYRFDGLDIFKGIPYAKARRFHAPEPAVWDGVLDATSYGYVCPLPENDISFLISANPSHFPCFLSFSISRCSTLILYGSCFMCFANALTIVTERCFPPVQPMLITS